MLKENTHQQYALAMSVVDADGEHHDAVWVEKETAHGEYWVVDVLDIAVFIKLTAQLKQHPRPELVIEEHFAKLGMAHISHATFSSTAMNNEEDIDIHSWLNPLHFKDMRTQYTVDATLHKCRVGAHDYDPEKYNYLAQGETWGVHENITFIQDQKTGVWRTPEFADLKIVCKEPDELELQLLSAAVHALERTGHVVMEATLNRELFVDKKEPHGFYETLFYVHSEVDPNRTSIDASYFLPELMYDEGDLIPS